MTEAEKVARNVGTLFSEHVGTGALAVVDAASGRELTFEELDAACNAVANGLRARGLGRGDRVGIFAFNHAEYVEVLFGSMRAGCVPVPLNAKLPRAAVEDLVRDADAKLVFVDRETAARAPADIPAIELDGEAYQAFVRPGPAEILVPEKGDLYLHLYTSGSTGRPKGVLLPHAGFFDTAVRQQADIRVLIAGPLYHMAGLRWTNMTLGGRSAIVLLPRFEAKSYVAAIARHRPNILVGTPAMFGMMLGDPSIETADISSVTGVNVGSAPFSAQICTGLQARFPTARVWNSYGITELGPLWGPHPDSIERPVESIGYPHKRLEMKLVAGPSADEGILWIRTPTAMVGYHNRPEETSSRFREGGWFDTGDVCRRDERGFFYFLRRADDMFVSGGENIYPREVEAVLERHPDVLQVAVVPVPHPLKGHVPVAFVVPRPGTQPTEESLREWTLARVPPYLHPRRVYLETSLPMAGTMKVDKHALQARAAADASS